MLMRPLEYIFHFKAGLPGQWLETEQDYKAHSVTRQGLDHQRPERLYLVTDGNRCRVPQQNIKLSWGHAAEDAEEGLEEPEGGQGYIRRTQSTEWTDWTPAGSQVWESALVKPRASALLWQSSLVFFQESQQWEWEAVSDPFPTAGLPWPAPCDVCAWSVVACFPNNNKCLIDVSGRPALL